jgi:hypothetical protein
MMYEATMANTDVMLHRVWFRFDDERGLRFGLG